MIFSLLLHLRVLTFEVLHRELHFLFYFFASHYSGGSGCKNFLVTNVCFQEQTFVDLHVRLLDILHRLSRFRLPGPLTDSSQPSQHV